MEKYVDVMRQCVELCETMVEGLQHIQNHVNNGDVEEVIYLVDDVIVAFLTVEKSLLPLRDKVHLTDVEKSASQIKRGLEMTVQAYEGKEFEKMKEIFQFTLGPSLKKWKEHLENTFNPYLLS